MKRSELKRVTIEVDKEFHAKIKIEATMRNMTIKDYMMQTVLERIARDEKYRKTN
jgi:hypothetical protein